MFVLIAFFLDPRMKGGVGTLNAGREIIYEEIRAYIIDIADMERGHQHHHQGNDAHQPVKPQQIPVPHEDNHMQPVEDDIFDEITNHYIDNNFNRGAEGAERDPGFNIATTANAELPLYKHEPMIELKKDDGIFNCQLIDLVEKQ
jgi:hypothetical protein